MQWELFLDLATTTGWTLRSVDGTRLLSGTWNFAPKRGDGAGMRFLRLQEQLDHYLASWPLRRVVYEQPGGHFKSAAADNIAKGLVSHVQSWCERVRVPCEGYSASEIKKQATGKGNAKKPVMLAAAKAEWPEQDIVDDNQADSLWLMHLAINGPRFESKPKPKRKKSA